MWKITILLSSFVVCAVFSSPNGSQNSQASQPQVTKLAAPEALLPISVIWDECTQSVYWVDFFATGNQSSIFRYDYEEGRTYSAYIVGQSSPVYILPISSECAKFENLFAVGVGHQSAVLQWDGKFMSATLLNTLFSVEENDPTSLMAVAHPSERGTFYAGTFHSSFCSGPANSSLYMYRKSNGVQKFFTGSQTTTGIASDKSKEMLYHVDSCGGKITGFQSSCSGDICNGRVIYDFSPSSSGVFPIGLATDSNGFIYTGSFLDGNIWMINPRTSSGIPVTKLPFGGVTGLAFGGKGRNVLFAILGTAQLDVYSVKVTGITQTGSSLFAITDLANGRKYRRTRV